MLTENQKNLAKWICSEHEKSRLPETFIVCFRQGVVAGVNGMRYQDLTAGDLEFCKVSPGTFNELVQAGFLNHRPLGGRDFILGGTRYSNLETFEYTIRAGLRHANKRHFEDDPAIAPVSALAQPHPPEIMISTDRLRAKYPDPKKLGFLVMRFTKGKAFEAIVAAIKETAAKYHLSIVRADEHGFHADLWGNVRTFLHGCSFGIAVYERIEEEEPNANVGLEVGYLLAMNKPIMLLKERTVKTLQADLMGKLYKEFDAHDPAGSIPQQLIAWLQDNGVIV